MRMRSTLFDLSGKGAIVTGSSKGIGKAIAQALAAHGAEVIVSSRDGERCHAAAREIVEDGGQAHAVAANVGKPDDVARLFGTAEALLPGVDILVCNAAVSLHYGPLGDISDEAFHKTMDTNVLSAIRLATFAAPVMAARGGGSIILISSIGGFHGSPVIGAYSLSKAADFQLARNLAVELGPRGVTVNCIAPGLVRTDSSRALMENKARLARILGAMPLGRVAEPEDIAGAAVFLSSRAARHVTGQVIAVDGGTTIGGYGN